MKKIKILHLEITRCWKCLYCTFDEYSAINNYFCDNPLNNMRKIVDDEDDDMDEILNSIPEWCPLPDKTD